MEKESDEALLLNWMIQKKFSVEDCPLKVDIFEATGRGMRATRDIRQGEVLLQVPESLIITSQTAMESSIKDCLAGHKLTPLQALCLFLMTERHQGDLSKWFPYINSLPTSYTTPVHWPSDVVSRLPTVISNDVIEQQCSVEALHRGCCGAIESIERTFPALRGAYSYEAFCWAWSSVNTRCVYWLREDHPDLQKDGEDHYALVPYLDMLNHSTQVQTVAGFDRASRSYKITTQSATLEGDQVFIQYGPHSNNKLLLEYGFVLEDNITDFLEVSWEEVLNMFDDDGSFGSKHDQQLRVIHENQLDKGHGVTVDGLTWSLQVALKILALPQELTNAKWTVCLEDGYISNDHRLTTQQLVRKLLNAKKKDYQSQQKNTACDVEIQIKNLCDSYLALLDRCFPTSES